MDTKIREREEEPEEPIQPGITEDILHGELKAVDLGLDPPLPNRDPLRIVALSSVKCG